MNPIVAGALVLGASVSVSAGAVLVTNGDFETDAGLFTVWPGYVGGGGTNPATIPGWTHVGGVGINPVVPGAPADSPFDDPSNTSDGAFAFIQGTASISQVLNGFTIGQSYIIRLNANARGCCGDPPEQPIADVLIDDVVIGSSTDVFPGSGAVITAGADDPWYTFDIPFEASAESHTLQISTRPAAGGDSTLVVDNITVIPEPSAALLSLLAAAGLVAIRRRR